MRTKKRIDQVIRDADPVRSEMLDAIDLPEVEAADLLAEIAPREPTGPPHSVEDPTRRGRSTPDRRIWPAG